MDFVSCCGWRYSSNISEWWSHNTLISSIWYIAWHYFTHTFSQTCSIVYSLQGKCVAWRFLMRFCPDKYFVDQLENVLGRFTKRVTSFENCSCPERLAILEFEPPKLRRMHYDLIQNYNIFNNWTWLNPAEYLTVHQPTLSARASSSILIEPFKRPNYVLSSSFYRSTDGWNSISLTLKQSTSLNVFKNTSNLFNLTKFLKEVLLTFPKLFYCCIV